MNPTSLSDKLVVLITGTSSGIGQACAARLQQHGYRVFGTSRQPQPDNGSFTTMVMDVDDDASVQSGIDRIVQQTGRLDVVVNNAGITYAGAIEDTSIAEAQAQFETNFFGVLRVCRTALPVMRQQRSGTIVNISSLAGVIATPFHGVYSASKFALEGLTEALRIEVAPFNIHVVSIRPGDARTHSVANRRRTSASQTNPAYHARFNRAVSKMEHDETHGQSPEAIADTLERILDARAPRAHYVVGPFVETLAARVKPFIPGGLFQWFIAKYYDS
jgi:NAD(P)-dependent dehydrogenase (short-subunit alcohol dehydrogenase family)